jgi:hypothetical protein
MVSRERNRAAFFAQGAETRGEGETRTGARQAWQTAAQIP